LNTKQTHHATVLLKSFLLFFFIFSGSLVAQSNDPYTLARAQALQLKNGILLVNLHTYTATVTALQNTGKQKEAEKLKSDLKEMNQHIINAFETYFKYCHVYYFYSNSCDSIKAQKYISVVFDSAYNPVSVILLDTASIFIADFSTTDNNRNANADPDDKWEKSKPNDFTMSGLILRDKNMIQLNKPFPYYVRVSNFEMVLPKEKIYKAVIKLNRKLNEF
jgi:hypothetical protein